MFILNTLPQFGLPLDAADVEFLGVRGSSEAESYFAQREDYRTTPLVALPALALAAGVSSIHVKDEGQRLSLGSFKALGGAYAVACLAVEHASEVLGRAIPLEDWRSADVAAAASTITICCATDGNHGRSVAQGARLVGAKCVIFVHAGVSEERAAAIGRFGAKVVRIDGNYDDSVAEASRVAAENGWLVVSDTSWPGYERIPRRVMQGYCTLVREALAELPEPPTHVFIQAGVGGFAAAVTAYLDNALADDRPLLTVVEPSRAPCLIESVKAGEPVKVDHTSSTVMAMLECFEPSLVAWDILTRRASSFMTIEDVDAVEVMKILAYPLSGDPQIISGESGGAGLAGFLKVSRDPSLRAMAAITEQSRILVVNTEGATDPLLYKEIVGLDAVA